MKISVDISMYPLNQNYESEIIAFIKHLQSYNNVEIKINGLSTQLFGEYQDIMNILNSEILKAFQKNACTVFAMKIVGLEAKEARL